MEESKEHPIAKLRQYFKSVGIEKDMADQYIMDFLLNEWGIYRRVKLKVSELLSR